MKFYLTDTSTTEHFSLVRGGNNKDVTYEMIDQFKGLNKDFRLDIQGGSRQLVTNSKTFGKWVKFFRDYVDMNERVGRLSRRHGVEKLRSLHVSVPEEDRPVDSFIFYADGLLNKHFGEGLVY